MVKVFTKLLNKALEEESISENWCHTHFSLLHKEDDPEDPNTWRPIAILSSTYKLLARLVFNRISSCLDRAQSEKQYGFRASRSTIHTSLVTEEMISKSFEFHFPLWIVSIDLRKAFDRIEHNKLSQALRKQGLEEGYIGLLQKIYEHQKGCWRL